MNYDPIMEPKYYLKASNLGATTSPQTANQLEQFTNLLNQGIVNVELAPIQPEIFDTIPDEHLREIKRLAELTGTKPSLHAPLIEPSGFSQQGWSETHRKENELQLINAIKRANLLDPNGNIPVTIHGANVFGAEWDKLVEEGYKQRYEKATEEEREMMPKVKHMPRMMAAVNQEDGKIVPLEYEEKYMIAQEKPEIWDPYKRLSSMNSTQWDQEKLKIMEYNNKIAELRERQLGLSAEMVSMIPHEEGLSPEEQAKVENLKREVSAIESHIGKINSLNNSQFNDMHNMIQRFGDEKDLNLKAYNKSVYPPIEKFVKDIEKRQDKLRIEEKEITRKEKIEEADRKRYDEIQQEKNNLSTQMIETITKDVANMPTPQIWTPVNEFAKIKASDTLSNAAFQAFKQIKDPNKMPIISVENSYPMMPLARADDLKEVIKNTREKFVDKLVKDGSVSKKEAEKIAEKVIGATWDVGHINMLRKGGYSEKEIVEESGKIAPYLKHLHITDNFGSNDTHLPPGMGNVPVNKILDALKKEGASPEKIRSIVEAGGFVQHFKESPFPYILEAMESPIYNMKGSPYWNKFRDVYSPYSMGYGDFLPSEHFKMYGSGFSGMPRELGGEVGGDKSRFAGAPNQ